MTGLRPAAVLVLVLPLALSACGGGAGGRGWGLGGLVDSQDGWSGDSAALPRAKGAPLAPDHLKGLDVSVIEEVLGPPGFRRRDPPAEIWQYRTRACILDLFVYEGKDGRVVAHHAVRVPPGQPAMTDRACLDEVQGRRASLPAG